MFTQFRTQIHQYLLNKRLQKFSRVGAVVNYYQAKNIGLLADATRPESYKQVQQYAQKLKADGKKVRVLYYLTPSKERPSILEDHITGKQINLWYIPKGTIVEDFMKQPFDILLNLCEKSNLPLEYISALSAAHYKTGRYIEDKTACFDLMVYLNEQKQVNHLINETDQLLKAINKPQNAAI